MIWQSENLWKFQTRPHGRSSGAGIRLRPDWGQLKAHLFSGGLHMATRGVTRALERSIFVALACEHILMIATGSRLCVWSPKSIGISDAYLNHLRNRLRRSATLLTETLQTETLQIKQREFKFWVNRNRRWVHILLGYCLRISEGSQTNLRFRISDKFQTILKRSSEEAQKNLERNSERISD